MPEVGGDAAILLAPDDPEAWTKAMLDLASNVDRRRQLSVAAGARAKRFDWERSAAAMLAIYEEAIRSPRRADMNQGAPPSSEPVQVENVG